MRSALKDAPEIEDDRRPEERDTHGGNEDDENRCDSSTFDAQNKARGSVRDRTHKQWKIGYLHPPGRPNHLHFVTEQKKCHEERDAQEKEYRCRELLEKL